MAYQHVLVVSDGSVSGDDAVRAASRLAAHDHSRLTVVAVAEIERPGRGCVFGTSTWNDVLRDAAAADLERARKVVESPAHFTVVCGERSRAVAEAARDLGCDAIMIARPRRRLTRILRRDAVRAVSRRTDCAVLQPR
jgi:nucleotide-binding universal stress UspA family protein